MCVVVRYFGGVKLGAGGLIRAYGAAARQVLREAPVEVLIPTCTWELRLPESSLVGVVYETVAKFASTANAVTSGEEYGADGSFTVSITCDLEARDRIRATLVDATRGGIEFLDEVGDKDETNV